MTTGNQIFSTLADGKLTVEVVESQFPDPTGNQVLVKMEAAPINPSDLAILTGAADLENGRHDPGLTLAYRISRALDAEITEAFPFVEE